MLCIHSVNNYYILQLCLDVFLKMHNGIHFDMFVMYGSFKENLSSDVICADVRLVNTSH